MENNEIKHKGFMFVRSAKESGSMFMTGYLVAAKDIKAGEKVELIAHPAKKTTQHGEKFFYVFERDEYEGDKKDGAKKSAKKEMKKSDAEAPF